MLPLTPQHGDFLVAPRQPRQLAVVLNDVWVGCDAGDRGRVRAHPDLVECQEAGVFDFRELRDEFRIGWVHRC